MIQKNGFLFKKIILYAGLFLLYTGCAGPRSVTLYYPAQITDMYNQEPKSVLKLAKPATIVLIINDARTQKMDLGCARNTYGKILGRIVTTNDPVLWVRSALQAELEKRQYRLAESEVVELTDSIPLIRIDINEISCNVYGNYESCVSLTVRMNSDNDSVLVEKIYQGKGNGGENFFTNPQQCASSCALALSDVTTQLGNDLYKAFVSVYHTSTKPVEKLKDTVSLRDIAYMRARSHGKSGSAARAAALAMASKFKQVASQARTTVRSKSETNSANIVYYSSVEKISGKRAIETVKPVVSNLDKRLEAVCIQNSSPGRPVTGTMSIQLTVEASGIASDIINVDSAIKDTVLTRLILEEVAKISFPAIESSDDKSLILFHCAVKDKEKISARKELWITLIVFSVVAGVLSIFLSMKAES